MKILHILKLILHILKLFIVHFLLPNTMLKHRGSQGRAAPIEYNTPSAWTVRREYLLINDGLRPEGDIVCVALERLAVGHAEQQTGLGIVHGVLA